VREPSPQIFRWMLIQEVNWEELRWCGCIKRLNYENFEKENEMFGKINTYKNRLTQACLKIYLILVGSAPKVSEKGEGIASYAAIIAIALVIIIAVMSIFRGAVEAAFERISQLLRGI